MSFLAGLARSSTQLTCERSITPRSWRIALPVVPQTAVGVVNVRRNGTQTPDKHPADTRLWIDITSTMNKAMHHSRDTTPDQAWERRSEFKYTKLQQVPLPGPSTGKLARLPTRLFRPFFLFLPFYPLSCSPFLVLLGRTVFIAQEQSFVSALNKLDQILRTNYVRRELMESRFFTKGHVRRHKLNAIRWRRRFAQMVSPRSPAPECLCLRRLRIVLSRCGKRCRLFRVSASAACSSNIFLSALPFYEKTITLSLRTAWPY